ncbi:hybrid sensor histidine kinase/response regulator [Mariprofundus ferrooxydans]|uniref:Chemotaxis protein CheA n=1 Tax=Mariprofundus ferrooxydans PV-1 TaxID=314345 RepID=Q0EY33_9PROT|nr:response regulator [Mariprofundus ferrooxydans]EAU54193.1 Gliding motility regulatory protein [Mariprofundus ferrooxydans PV-1]KON47742.1 transcriptional regulator [Mariprofundus ferrooxydans]
MSEFDVSGFLASFFDEARERLLSINRRLVLLEAGSLDSDGLNLMRRDAHTIKGSAQMLGVQDVSELGHLFEDAMEYTIRHSPEDVDALTQFLYDVHDALQERIGHHDAKRRLDTSLLYERFQQLCTPAPDAAIKSSAEKSNNMSEQADTQSDRAKQKPKTRQGGKGVRRNGKVSRDVLATIKDSLENSLAAATKREPAPDLQAGVEHANTPAVPGEKVAASSAAPDSAPRSGKARKRKRQVPKALLVAIKGSIEESLERGENAATDLSVGAGSESAPVASTPIDFRPPDEVVPAQQPESQQNSGNFLRVDRARLLRLSNQIIELGSDRYRPDASEARLRKLADDITAMKERIQALTGSDGGHGMRVLAADLERQGRQAQILAGELHHQHKRSAAMLDDLRDQVFGLMLRPLASVFSVFPRTVRDVAGRSGKKVQLLITGESIEMDQLAAESLTEPLVHLVNNAIAHGIENSAMRLASGKPEEGQITVTARRTGGLVSIDVMDDGLGMDVDELRTKAIAKGLISDAEAVDMDDREVLELIFHPGFSTRSVVDDLAGRGMGMSVVQDVMRELRGTIHIHTEKGRGTRFRLTLPVAIGLQPVIVFRIADQRFGMISNLVKKVLPLQEQTIRQGHGPYARGYIDYEQHRVPLIDLRTALMMGEESAPDANSGILIVEHLEGYLGLVVDELFDTQQLMVREIDPYLRYYHPVGLMGCAIIDDGSVLLLIEPDGLKLMWRTTPDVDVDKLRDGKSLYTGRRILLVDDSTIALQVEKSMFEALGFQVDTAIGASDMLEKVGLHGYDLLVSDVEMPEMDGISLIRHLREQAEFAHIPILIIATREADEDRQLALDAGANAYLVKRHIKGREKILRETVSRLINVDESLG